MPGAPGASADETILDHLKTRSSRRFPVDDWFAGRRARARANCTISNGSTHLAEAFTGDGDSAATAAVSAPGGRSLAGALDFPATMPEGEPFRDRRGQAALHGALRRALRRDRRQAGLLLDEWTEVIPRADRGHRARLPLRPAELGAAADAAACAATELHGRVAVAGPRRHGARDDGPRQEARDRAGPYRHHGLCALPACARSRR